jgi:two-component system response regulator MprA
MELKPEIMTYKANILLVEDDPAVLSSLKRRLDFEGYSVDLAETGTEAIERFSAKRPDLILLDLMLPEIDGFQIIEEVRSSSNVPILIITAKSGVGDLVSGFERGADDYLVKPFVIEELLARIRALIRRASQKDAAEMLIFGDLTLNLLTRKVTRGGSQITLTPREFSILEYFLNHQGQVLSREQIFEAVWGTDHMGDSNIIDVNIRSIREKTETGGAQRLIQTVRGIGYTLREG